MKNRPTLEAPGSNLGREKQSNDSQRGDGGELWTGGPLTVAPVDEVLAVELQHVVWLTHQGTLVIQRFRRRQTSGIAFIERAIRQAEVTASKTMIEFLPISMPTTATAL